jgi:hypothetical protein
MGLEGPKHLEQVKQIKLSQLLSETRTLVESGNHHEGKRMAKANASQAP